MDELNKVLERMQSTLKEKEPNNNTLPMLQHGLTKSDGNQITRQVETGQPEKKVPEKLQQELPPSIMKELTDRNKAQLTEMLGQIYLLQKVYGKTTEQLQIIVEGFAWALAGYKMSQINKAMREYILNNSDVPAPADILKILKEHEKPSVPEATIEQLLRYRERGITLSPSQIERLKQAGYP